jgi:short-subunit dehydrogenase
VNKDKTDSCYLISGLSGSIGGALADILISKGCKVIGISRKKICANLRSKYPSVSWLQYDLSLEDVNADTITRLKEIIGDQNLKTVFHCAGIHSKGHPMELSQDEYLESIRGNLISTVNIVKLTLDLMHPGGSILVLNSQASIAASNEEIAYGVSKRALSAYIEGMQVEATKRKVQLVNVLPGAVKSSMAEHRDNYDKFIDTSELANLLINISEVGPSIRIKDIEILRRNY